MSDLSRALTGALRLMRFDRSGIDWFEATPTGVWRSFLVALPILPLHLLLNPLPGPEDADLGLRVLLALLVYAVLWLAFPVLMVAISTWIGRRDRYLRFVVAYNWASGPQNLLQFLAPAALSVILPAGPAAFAAILLSLYVIATAWFTVRVGLAVSGWLALGITLLDTLLGQLIVAAV